MKPFKTDISGAYNFRFATLDIVATIEFLPDGEYMDIVEMNVFSTRRNDMVPASDRLMTKFQEANWDYLEGKCSDYLAGYAEYMRDVREDIGDKICHERMGA